MKLSASKFAEASGLSVVTIGRYCKNGRISAEKLPNGKGWLIDPSELDRLNLKPDKKGPMLGSETPVLEAENRGLQQLVTTIQQELDDLRADRDAWREQADGWRKQAENLTMTLMLPAPANAPPSETKTAPPEMPVAGQGRAVGGFWSRLWGKTPSND